MFRARPIVSTVANLSRRAHPLSTASAPSAWASSVPLDLEHNSPNPPGQFRIKTFNKISEKGLSRFPRASYTVRPGDSLHIGGLILRVSNTYLCHLGSSQSMYPLSSNSTAVRDCSDQTAVFNLLKKIVSIWAREVFVLDVLVPS